MNHPLSGSTSDLTDAELANKISELQKKLGQSYMMGNPNLIRQIEMLLGDLREEQGLRDRKKMETAESNNKGTDWDDLIDV